MILYKSDIYILTDPYYDWEYYGPAELTFRLDQYNTTDKIRKMVYEWGDGTSDTVNYFPSPKEDYTLLYPKDVGNPLNYPQKHVYYPIKKDVTTYNVTISIYKFGSKTPEVITRKFNLITRDFDFIPGSIPPDECCCC
jgi:hypothetical protein